MIWYWWFYFQLIQFVNEEQTLPDSQKYLNRKKKELILFFIQANSDWRAEIVDWWLILLNVRSDAVNESNMMLKRTSSCTVNRFWYFALNRRFYSVTKK